MRIAKSFLPAIVFGLLVAALEPAQDDVAALISRLAEPDLDIRTLHALEAHPPDPRIKPGLEQAFDLRTEKSAKQRIAVTLLRLGDLSPKFFEFLAGYARAAVKDRTPLFMDLDASGHEIRGQFSAEFRNWCKQNGKDQKTTAALQIGEYPTDVHLLAESQDPRANAIFREGLESPYPNVVASAVEGLGRLQDFAALPLIEKACTRLRGGQIAIAQALPWFGGREAERLMARIVPDVRHREFLTGQVQQLRQLEVKRALARTGVPREK